MARKIQKNGGPKEKVKFNSPEQEVLIEEITLKMPQMINSQEPGNILPDTNPIWEDILNKVNRVATTEQSIEDLKRKWLDLSQRVMEQIAELRKQPGRFEGTSTADLQLTPFQEKVRQILLMANIEGVDTGGGEVMGLEPTTEQTTEEGKRLGALSTIEKTTKKKKKQLGAARIKEKTSEAEKQLRAGLTTEKTAYVARKLGARQLLAQNAQGIDHSQSIPLEQRNIKDSQMQQLQGEIREDQVANVRDNVQTEESIRPTSSPPEHLHSQPYNGGGVKDNMCFENYARQLNLLEEYTQQVAQHTQLFLKNNSLHNQLIGALIQHIKVIKQLNETITTFVLENQSACRSFAKIANVPKPNWQRQTFILQPQNVAAHRQDMRPSGGTLQEARLNSSVDIMQSPCRRSQRSRDRGLGPPAEKRQK